MGFEASVLRRATRRLKEQRERRAAEAQRRRTKIYESIPQAAEIDRRLRRSEIQAAQEYMAALALPGFTQDVDSATGEYVPHFDLTGV